jgi:AsmA protein
LVILVPALLWLAVVVVAPTGWARRHVVAVLEARTGRCVGLERLSVCPFGGIHLTNLEIGSPQGRSDPWLVAADVRLDLGLLQILRGTLRPSRVEVEGAKLRVLRRADGTAELADLLEPARDSATHAKVGARAPAASDPVVVRVTRGDVTIVDEPTETRLHVEDVEGEASCEGPRTVVEHLRGMLNGGPIRFVGQLDRADSAVSLEAQLRADDVALDGGMKIVRYVVPVLAGAPAAVRGRLHADLYVQGRASSWAGLGQALRGQGVIAASPIDLDGAPLFAELSRLAELSKQGRAASIHSDFALKDRRITTDHLTIKVARVPITLSGWTDFDGRIEYQMKIEGLGDRLPARAQRLLSELNLDVGALTSLSLSGNLNQIAVRVTGLPVDDSVNHAAGSERNDRERLRLLGRQLRDKILR